MCLRVDRGLLTDGQGQAGRDALLGERFDAGEGVVQDQRGRVTSDEQARVHAEEFTQAARLLGADLSLSVQGLADVTSLAENRQQIGGRLAGMFQ